MHDDDDERELPDADDLESPGDADLLDPCPNCRRLMYDDTDRCPHCGHYINDGAAAPKDARWLLLVALAFVLILALLWMR